MANLSDVVEELRELQEVTAYNSSRIEKPLEGLENAIRLMTTSLSNQLGVMIDLNEQQSVDDKFKAEEDKENASENKKQNEKQTLQLTQVGSELKKMFGGLGSIFKTGLLAAAIPLLFGASGGPLTALLGLATGNPFLIAIGALATLIDVIINGGDVFGRISEQWGTFSEELKENYPMFSLFAGAVSALAAVLSPVVAEILDFAAKQPELAALSAGLIYLGSQFGPLGTAIGALSAYLIYQINKIRGINATIESDMREELGDEEYERLESEAAGRVARVFTLLKASPFLPGRTLEALYYGMFGFQSADALRLRGEELANEFSALEEANQVRLENRTRLTEELAQLQEDFDNELITQRQLEAGTALKNQIIDFSNRQSNQTFNQMNTIRGEILTLDRINEGTYQTAP